jgi:hypothetical protein
LLISYSDFDASPGQPISQPRKILAAEPAESAADLKSKTPVKIENSRGKLSFSSLSRQALYQIALKFCHPQPATGSKLNGRRGY